MDSRTKRRLEPVQLNALVARIFGDRARLASCDELADGTFNAVYDVRVEPGAHRVIVKASPPPGVPLLTYERDIMRTEAQYYRLTSTRSGVPTPRVVGTDFSRSSIDGDLLVTSHLPGTGWHRLSQHLDAADTARLRYDLGAIVARTHQVTGDRFGYFQDRTPQGTTWRTAFFAMPDAVFADAERFGVELPIGPAAMRRDIERCAHLLEAVTVPSLAHFDLWEGNILLDERAGRYELTGIIDGERAMWADPAADFASLALFGDIASDRDFLAGYGSSAGEPYEITPQVGVRVAMYKAYLDLIMLVEWAPRGYDPAERAHVLHLAEDDLSRSLDTLRSYSD